MFPNDNIYGKVKVLVSQLCLTLWAPVREILQARILEWVATSFSRGSSWPRERTQASCIARCFLVDGRVVSPPMLAFANSTATHSLLKHLFMLPKSSLWFFPVVCTLEGVATALIIWINFLNNKSKIRGTQTCFPNPKILYKFYISLSSI